MQDNRIRCWGRNDLGQLGIGTIDNLGDGELPTAAAAIAFTGETGQFSTIVVGATRTCALMPDTAVARCWGDNGDGGLGYGEIDAMPYAKATDWGRFTTDSPIVEVAAGALHMCLRQFDERLRCWGMNAKAQLGLPNLEALGDNETPVRTAPVDVGPGPNGQPAHVKSVIPGTRHTCALLDAGQPSPVVRCWGYNADGQLGLGYASMAPIDYVGGDAEHVPARLPPVQVFPPAPRFPNDT